MSPGGVTPYSCVWTKILAILILGIGYHPLLSGISPSFYTSRRGLQCHCNLGIFYELSCRCLVVHRSLNEKPTKDFVPWIALGSPGEDLSQLGLCIACHVLRAGPSEPKPC